MYSKTHMLNRSLVVNMPFLSVKHLVWRNRNPAVNMPFTLIINLRVHSHTLVVNISMKRNTWQVRYAGSVNMK